MASGIELLPYQQECLADHSRFKALMWARGCRKTFTVTLEIVDDCFDQESIGKRTTWVILSRGERQAREAMEEVKRHCRAYNLAASEILESDYTSEDGQRYKQLEVTLPLGSRILALPANPDTARGYTANVFLDEFAIHAKSRDIWRALYPTLRGRFRVIVSSTPKGKGNVFYEIMNSEGTWSKHVVDIYRAVADGLPFDIDKERKALNDPDGWDQEYCLKWLDESSAWLDYDLINSCQDELANRPELYGKSPVYVGLDLAMRNDLWAAVVLEPVGDVLWLRELITRRRPSYQERESLIAGIFNRYTVARLCLDQTGMGEDVTQRYQDAYGSSRVEGILFNSSTKLVLANGIKQAFEDHQLRIPLLDELREDLHKIKKIPTATGAARFDADSDSQGHADRFWALALAIHANQGTRLSVDHEVVERWDLTSDPFERGGALDFAIARRY